MSFPQGIGISNVAQNPTLRHVFAMCSFGGWCAVFGAEPPKQLYECVDFNDLLATPVLVLRWNPCVATLLTFAECGPQRAAVVHVVDVATQAHQVLRLRGLTSITGLDWCSRY